MPCDLTLQRRDSPGCLDKGADGFGGAGDIVRVEIGAEIAAGFGDGGAVGGGSGFAVAEALGDRQAPSLVERGEQRKQAVLVEAGEGGI